MTTIPAGWKLVPIEPTRKMWEAVNKLDDEMAAGAYDGKGASIEQIWACLVDAAPSCLTCGDHGMVGGLTQHSGYDAEQCPDCAAPASPVSTVEDAHGVPRYQWLTTVAQMKVLAAELTLAAESMGGDDDESADVELILSVAKPGTVQDDDGDLNTDPILTVCLAEYPEEGVYPIDPCDPTGGRISPPRSRCWRCAGCGAVPTPPELRRA